MTREEAIKKFEKQLHSALVVLDSGFGTRPGESDRVYRERKEMAEIALSALRAQQEQERNEPLTLDELRQRVGSWVWVVVNYEHCKCEGYALVPTPAFVAYLDQTIPIDFYGKKFVAYEHMPEEHFRDGTKMVEQDQSPDSGEMMPQWISVKDRLPEKSGDYIVYYSNTANNKPLISMRHFYGEIPGAFLHNKAMTHWMPMPQPPERPLVLKQGKAFKYEVDDPGFDMSCFSKPEEGHHE